MKRGKLPKKVPVKNASRLKVGIVMSEYYEEIMEPLLAGALDILKNSGVFKKNIFISRMPGSFELPYGCLRMIRSRKPAVILALGCIIKGETDHDKYIASAVSQGLMNLITVHGTPIAFGVMTTNNYEQAVARSRGDMNKGREAAIAALSLFVSIKKKNPRIRSVIE